MTIFLRRLAKKNLAAIICLAIAATLGLTGSVGSAQASVEDFSFSSFRADYRLSLGAHDISQLTATETLVAEFPQIDQNHGIRRAIPDSYGSHDLKTEIISVTDENGRPRDFTTESADGFENVISKPADGSFVHGTQTYVIKYRQKWVVANKGKFDEFYWDVNGSGWAQSFGEVSATVHLEGKLADALNSEAVSCYQGSQGSAQFCDSHQITKLGSEGVRLTFASSQLAAFQTLTINLPFKAGVINTGDVSRVNTTPAWFAFFIALSLLILLLAGAIGYRFWVLSGRNRRPFTVVQYAGPVEPELAVVSVVISKTSRWQSAAILQLAMHKWISISVSESGDWLLTRLKDGQELPGAIRLLEELGLSEVGATIGIGKKLPPAESRRLATAFTGHLAAAVKASVALKYFGTRKVKVAFLAWVLSAILLATALVAAGSMDQIIDAGFAGLVLILAAIVWIVLLVTLLKRPPTAEGLALRSHLAGLAEYIEFAEKDRLAFLQSPNGALRSAGEIDKTEVLKLYEKVLPWAVLLGLEKKWSAVLETYYSETQTPYWMPIGAFAGSSISSFNTASQQSLSAATSSGSSGSGSAGGGGGGGGGGGV
jgi:uncharacterized membrane protein YgcG